MEPQIPESQNECNPEDALASSDMKSQQPAAMEPKIPESQNIANNGASGKRRSTRQATKRMAILGTQASVTNEEIESFSQDQTPKGKKVVIMKKKKHYAAINGV